MHLFRQVVCFFLLAFPLLTFAQAEKDQVLLKNGSSFEGKIIEYQQGARLWLQLSNGDTLSFRDAEVKQLIQEGQALPVSEGTALSGAPKTKKKPYAFQEKGLYNATYFTTLSGTLASDFKLGLGLHHTTGYQFMRLFGLGIGLGIDTYSFDDGQSIYPLFVEARGYFLPKPVTPYYTFDAGYGFAFPNREEQITGAEGGLLFRGALGLRLGADSDTNVAIGVGYQYQKARLERQDFQGAELEIRELAYNRIVMRVGLIF